MSTFWRLQLDMRGKKPKFTHLCVLFLSLASHGWTHVDLFLISFFLCLLFIVKKKAIKQYPGPKGPSAMSVYSARSLEVCDSRGFQFVSKLARICHSCSHPLALATRQNLKKSHHLREQKNALVAVALLPRRRNFTTEVNSVCPNRPFYSCVLSDLVLNWK